jgi:hypothetical protein
VPLRLATLLAAQLFDLGTFMTMIDLRGVAAEANPLVADLFSSLGMPAVVVAKLSLIILVGSLAVAGAARGRRGAWAIVAAVPLSVAIVVGMVGGISNAVVILA